MGDAAIFTPEIAEELIARGFELVARTDKAYYFEDSVLLWRTVCELMEALPQSE
jgi:hypothetical protein